MKIDYPLAFRLCILPPLAVLSFLKDLSKALREKTVDHGSCYVVKERKCVPFTLARRIVITEKVFRK
ncbi:hypothetical protein TNCT_323631 [Trichonephila clavata]|uniref:Uncharacterized protein n=1 Tax=Trichonephila clavata TaxID=2740835 RepID=A0A8X6IZC9_TRICU|nr:hypothetical protein TNCT_323631 [Trichonephila clavata]